MYIIGVDYESFLPETYNGVVISFDSTIINYSLLMKDADKLGLHYNEDGSIDLPLELFKPGVPMFNKYKFGQYEGEIARFRSRNPARDIKMAIKFCQNFDEAIADNSLDDFIMSARLDLDSLAPEYFSLFERVDKTVFESVDEYESENTFYKEAA